MMANLADDDTVSVMSSTQELLDLDDLPEIIDDTDAPEKFVSDDEQIQAWVARSTKSSNSSLSALSAYQRAAESHGSMTANEQIALAAEYQNAMRAKGMLERGELNGFSQKRAREQIRKMDHQLEKLTSSCWRLAWLIVRENAEGRFGRDRASEMLPDLMSEANVALVEAARQFDPTRTPTFATYAARTVRDHIRMVLSREGYIHLAPSWSRLKRIASARVPELTSELGRTPSKEEIQEDLLKTCMAWAERKLTDEQRALPEAARQPLKMAKLRKQGMLGALRDIDEVMAVTQSIASLDQPLGDDGGATMADLLPNQGESTMFDNLELSELRATITTALSTLTDRERTIIMLRFGFVDAENWTYARIAEQYDVTPERIRQIERAVMGKLASPHGQYAALAAFLPSQL